ncbi:MAG: hypothetical protein IH934_01315 [Nanoarchaeota archaeon]|nr:hypothetical protein [Nanoarchaeota archaeon]
MEKEHHTEKGHHQTNRHDGMEKHHNVHEHHNKSVHEKIPDDKKIKINFFENLKGIKLINLLVVALSLLLILNLFLAFGLKNTAKAKIEEAEELTRPAEIQLTVIENTACTDCFDLSQILNSIKNNKVKITNEESLDLNSAKAKDLINKYNIKRIPTVLVFGEIEKSGNLGLKKESDALIFTGIKAPYFDTSSNEIMGRVSLTYINDATCGNCTDLSIFVRQLKQLGVAITDEKVVDIKNADSLISKYSLDKVPSLIISSDLSAYEDITKDWQQVGTVENDGSYIFRTISPPYFDLNKNKVVGLVDVTYLSDKSCLDCYDVEIHRQILSNPRGINININSEKKIDISDDEGKELVEKYSITKVPTIILSSDFSDYPSAKSFGNFFTVEDDGSYVFRSLEAMGKNIVYKDLSYDSSSNNKVNDIIEV